MSKFNISYIKIKTSFDKEITLTIEAENVSSAITKGYAYLGGSDWDLDSCKEV